MFSDYTGLYFYSALIQSNAALFAVAGIFVMYKLDSMERKIDKMPVRMQMKFPGSIIPTDIVDFTIGNKQKREKIISDLRETENEVSHKKADYFDSWLNLTDRIRPIKKSIKTPMILMGLGIILNTLLLIMSESIHSLSTKLETTIFLSIILYQGIIIYKLYSIAKEMLLAEYDR